MRIYSRIIPFLCLCLSYMGAKAQDSHWSINIYDYKYDMTAYVTLTEKGVTVADLSDYEIAAFCGDECRGVATIQTAEKDGEQTQYGYLRIRSNLQEGETISLKVYKKSANRESVVDNTATVSFKAESRVGLPSDLMAIPLTRTLGDVNGDGVVNVVDVTMTISHILGQNPEGFDKDAADVNNDGVINIVDVTTIIDIILVSPS